MTGIPFLYRSRSNSRENYNNLKDRSPKKSSQSNSKPFYGNSNFKIPSRNGSPNPKPSNSQKNSNYYSRTQSPHYNRDGNRSRRPYSHNRLRNVRNYINLLLEKEEIDETLSNTENTDTQNVSRETLLKQQFNDLRLALNQDNQGEYFNCQGNVILSPKYTFFLHHVRAIFES